MKLNNRGWGLQIMMVFVLILMICLVIVASLINKNFSYLVNNDKTIETFDYTKIENDVIESTKKYIENKNIILDTNDTYTLTVKKLQSENFIGELRDNFSKCTGYSVVKNTGDKLLYNAYIRCGSNYKTKNYNSNLDN